MKVEELNPRQQEAVEHIEGPLLVLAGAGSGKTRVVTHRIAHLIEIGVPASEILAVTFTNKAADEMRRRVQLLTQAHVLSCTFHSLGARILRESITSLGFRSDFSIYDEEDSLKVIKNCLSTLHIANEKGILKKIKSLISSHKNDLLSPNEMEVEGHTDAEQAFTKIYPLYQTKLKEYNAVDFDDLLYLPVKLFSENADMREKYQSRWRFLLIDEYQDTNQAQYQLAKILAEKHGNIFVVGDPDQSIYSWRGAQYQNILNFDRDFPGATIIKLEQNYRSTNIILKASNAVIEENKRRYEKNLWSSYEDGEKIGLYTASNEHREADFVVETLLDYQFKENIPLDQMVIFYRTNAQSRIFEDALLSRRIPYTIIGGISFYQRKEIKDLLSFLRMIQTNWDFISFARSINLPKRGIGPTTLSKFQQFAEQSEVSIFTFCEQTLDEKTNLKLSARQKNGLREYINSILELRRMHTSGKKLFELISETIIYMHYLDHLKEDPESFQERKENIDALISKAAEWEEQHEGGTLTQFLEELSLKSSAEEDSNQPSLRLMTLHNGKGLEFNLVFIVGLEEDLLPHVNSKDSLDNLEEERRLFYVGMTRAKKKLFLCCSHNRYMWGTPRIMCTSRFIKEVPSEYVNNLSSAAEVYENGDEFSFLPGDWVVHKDFGPGVIQKSYNTSLGETYDVFFENANTTRSLVGKYAKLRPHIKEPF